MNLDNLEAGRALFAADAGGRNNLDPLARLGESIRESLCQPAGTYDGCADSVAENLGAVLEEREERTRRYVALKEEARRDIASLQSQRESYREQRDAEGARANRAEALAESRLAEAAEFRTRHAAAEERAEKAERQLAEYRTLLSALPLGMCRAYPAAFPLLRAYLADVEA